MAVVLTAFGLLTPSSVVAESYVGAYLGAAFTQDKELRTELELNGGPFVNGRAYDLAFDPTVVFGAKAGYFLTRPVLGGNLGAELDVYHYRPDLDEQRVRFKGLLAGVQADTRTPVQSADVEVTAVTLNLLYRFGLAREPAYPQGRFQPYVGIGGGAFIARLFTTTSPFDVNKDISDTDVQPGMQAIAGGRWFLTPRIALFAEYKFVNTQTFSFKFKESGTVFGFPMTETARDRAALTSHLVYGGVGFHW